MHLLLLAVTFASVTYAAPTEDLGDALVYAFAVVLILGAHEMGHFLMARQHRVDASWPWFIPVPFGFGTLGAVIRLRGRIPTRDALVDIGAAGPLCGLLIAVPLLIAGMTLSTVAPAPPPGPSGSTFPALSLLTLAGDAGTWVRLHWSAGSQLPPAPHFELMLFGDNLLTLGVQYLVKGPLPPGTEVYAHPLFIAAWFGLVVTMLNLLPVGQLDGGHVAFAWLGARAEDVGGLVVSALLVLSLFASVSWLTWCLVATRVVGLAHPQVVAPEAPLSRGRQLVALACLGAFVVTFMPLPVDVLSVAGP